MARSKTVDFDDRFGKGLRGFLRHVVADALQGPVGVRAGEVAAITGATPRRSEGIQLTVKGHRGQRDDGALGKSFFETVVSGVALGQAKSPAIVMDHDGDPIRIVEGRRSAVERCVVEMPRRGGVLPDQFREIMRVLRKAEPTPFCGEIVLVPPRPLASGGSGFLLRSRLVIR